MRNCSIFVSLLLWLLTVPCQGQMLQENDSLATTDTVESRSYNLLIQIRGKELTGLCIMDGSPGQHVVGTIVNDFGTKIYDFTYDGRKARVLNVIKPIDRWYIRRVLRGDMAFIIANLDKPGETVINKRTIVHLPDGEIQATNKRFKIKYTFTPLKREL